MDRRLAASVGCGLMLVLASCGSSKSVSTGAPAGAAPAATAAAPAAATTAAPAAAAPASAAAAAAPAAAVPEILNFATKKVGGGDVNGSEFAGKPTAFWFWAPT